MFFTPSLTPPQARPGVGEGATRLNKGGALRRSREDGVSPWPASQRSTLEACQPPRLYGFPHPLFLFRGLRPAEVPPLCPRWVAAAGRCCVRAWIWSRTQDGHRKHLAAECCPGEGLGFGVSWGKLGRRLCACLARVDAVRNASSSLLVGVVTHIYILTPGFSPMPMPSTSVVHSRYQSAVTC